MEGSAAAGTGSCSGILRAPEIEYDRKRTNCDPPVLVAVSKFSSFKSMLGVTHSTAFHSLLHGSSLCLSHNPSHPPWATLATCSRVTTCTCVVRAQLKKSFRATT